MIPDIWSSLPTLSLPGQLTTIPPNLLGAAASHGAAADQSAISFEVPSSIKSPLASLQAKEAQRCAEVAGLRKDVATLQAQRDELNAEVSRLQEEVSKLRVGAQPSPVRKKPAKAGKGRGKASRK